MRALLVAAIVCLAGSVFADGKLPPMAPEAKAHLEKGLRAYDVQSYAEAIDEFRAGYQIDARPELLYALGQAERLSGDCKGAMEAYRSFLRTNPSSRQEASAKKNLQRCARELEAAASAAPRPPAPVEPAAERAAVPPPPEPVLPPPAPYYRDVLGGAALGIGLAGIGAGGALWGIGEGQIGAVNGASRYDQFARSTAGAQGAETLRIAGIVTVSVGGALLVVAAVRYGLLARRARR
jgi:tetratricopeptide (TPR) repeat protein